MTKKPEPLTDDQLADLLQHLEEGWFDEGDLLANATATIAVLLQPPELRIRIAAMMNLPLDSDDEHVFAAVASLYGKELLRNRPKTEFGSFDEAIEAADIPGNPLDAVVDSMVNRVQEDVRLAVEPMVDRTLTEIARSYIDDRDATMFRKGDDDADPQGSPE